MKRQSRRFVLVLACLGGLAACSDYGEDVDAVKAADTGGMTNEALAARLAGGKGSVEWSGREAEQYPDNSSIVLVEATIEKTTRDGAARTIVLQYTRNRADGRVALFDVVVDGKPQGLLGGSVQLLLLQFE